MSEITKIAWCDSTVNFWRGCRRVSPGCVNCYIERTPPLRMAHYRLGQPRIKSETAINAALALNRKPWICPVCGHAMTEDESKGYLGCPNPKAKEDGQPARVMHVAQHHRRRIFSLSVGDWLDDEIPASWLAEMLDTIRQCDQCTWILCTKRPENWPDRFSEVWDRARAHSEFSNWIGQWIDGQPPLNVVLLASGENQEQADIRIPQLLRIPAACQGLSLEPLLGPVDVQAALNKMPFTVGGNLDAELHWLIAGGESGPNARPCNVEWIRSLVKQGQAAGVATFVKQLGADAYYTEPYTRDYLNHYLRDKKGGDPAEWPSDLRVQQWPKGF